MQYVLRTMYGVQDTYSCTDGVHVHFCYWIGWKDSTVLVIPSYPHPHPLRKTNHRWVCVAKLCFRLICTMSRSILHTCTEYVLGRIWSTWSIPFLFAASPDFSLFPRKPCDCSSTPRHMTRSLELSSRNSNADVWHPRQMWGTRPSENSILEVSATSLSTVRLWDHMLRMHLWPQLWCHISFKKKRPKKKKERNSCIPANSHDQQILQIPYYRKKKSLQTAHRRLSLTKHRHSNIVFSWYWGLELCAGIQPCCCYVNFQVYRSYSWFTISNRSFCLSPVEEKCIIY